MNDELKSLQVSRMAGRPSRLPGARWAIWGVLSLVAACGGINVVTPPLGDSSGDGGSSGTGSGSGNGGSSGTDTGSGGSSITSGSGGAGEGLPCDVAAVLTAKCVNCHSSPPVGGAPTALLTYTDLTAPSKSDPTKSMAEVSLARMQSSTSPMPPKPGTPASAAEIASFQAWVVAGTPMGSCGEVDAGPNPFDAPPQCTSGNTWNGGNNGSKSMNPGMPCIQCHTQEGEGPSYAFAGTVYATAHEPDKCNAAVESGPPISTAVIEVVDKNGTVFTATVNSVGNFYKSKKSGNIVPPYTAKVKYDGRERVMATAQTSGDCNTCHTQNGTKDAPGRVLLP